MRRWAENGVWTRVLEALQTKLNFFKSSGNLLTPSETLSSFVWVLGITHGYTKIGVAHGSLDDGDGDALLGKDRHVGVWRRA